MPFRIYYKIIIYFYRNPFVKLYDFVKKNALNLIP